MAINARDVIGPVLTDDEIKECIDTARKLLNSIEDRADLHSRSCLERFNDILMGEIAERSVIKWIQMHGRFAESAVDKNSGQPDEGHDIILHSKIGYEITCSVKSSLSVLKSKMEDILETFHLSTKKSEIRGINIQVYFWLDLNGKTRVSTPSNLNMAIIGWCGRKDLEGKGESKYAKENRPVMNGHLKDLYPMQSLLNIIQ